MVLLQVVVVYGDKSLQELKSAFIMALQVRTTHHFHCGRLSFSLFVCVFVRVKQKLMCEVKTEAIVSLPPPQGGQR